MRVIGMISGTSFDAIEAVAADVELADGDPRRRPARPRLGALPAAAARGDRGAASARRRRRSRRSAGSTRRSASASPRSRARSPPTASRLASTLVCSHGQTVFHWVEGGRALGTLQLGQPAFIAEATGATVVADVRSRDVAAGGHGAPLASLLDVLLLGARPERACGSLNLGGIANVTIVAPDREPIAFDTGPASALMDAVVSAAQRRARALRPRRGGRPRAGRVDPELLAVFLAEPYYQAPPPKSTGKELFHLAYVRELVGGARDLDRRPARDPDGAVGRGDRRRPAPLRRQRRSSQPGAARATRR